MPRNATTSADGFRVYHWAGGNGPLHHQYGATQEADLLSVTSIRTINGTPFQLVTWQIMNVVRLTMGVRKAEWRDYSKSKRGRRVEGYRADGEFPGEFVSRLLETEGDQEKLTELTKWVRAAADEPRDIAAVRGSVVHALIEQNIPQRLINPDLIEQRMDLQWKSEGRKFPIATTPEDVTFVADAMDNYYYMRKERRFVILAQEVQVFNLTVGYAGSADVLAWIVPEDMSDADFIRWQKRADAGKIDIEDIRGVGGYVAVGDWKTSPDVYTSHVVQTVAYMAGEFIAEDGLIDERLTEMLLASRRGFVAKIRPDECEVDTFDMTEDILLPFFGSVAFARFLTFHKKPTALFLDHWVGRAPGVEPTEVISD